MTVDIYSDIACPWCYIGHRRFAEAQAAHPGGEELSISFRPYQLDPSLPESPLPLRDRLREKFGANADAMVRQVTETAAREGLELRFDRAQAVNTFAGHRLLRLAEQEYDSETQQLLAEKLFSAHFTEGKNVADHDVLAELAEAAGMDRDRVLSYLGSNEGTQEVREEIARAQRLGVRAVPTFVFDGQFAVQGAQPVDTFTSVIDQVRTRDVG